jgi:hypothetical protein
MRSSRIQIVVKRAVIWTFVLLLASLGLAGNKTGTFTGTIMDKMCAQMNSHTDMMKTEGAKDDKDCTLKCVKDGGSFALYDAGNKKVYALSDTKQVRQFAGQQVQITGTYDASTELLNAKNITAVK